MSSIHTAHTANSQGRAKKYLNETPQQRAQHREIELKDQRQQRKKGKRLTARDYRRIAELEIIFADRYGSVLPDDDAGADDARLMANHLAHLGKPDKRIRAWLRRWAPWYTERGTEWLIEKVMRKPLKSRADPLAQLLGLDDATRTRLGITTIGAIDCKKAKRAARRRKRNNAAKLSKRANAGAKPHAKSAAQRKEWEKLGMSRATYYRLGLHKTAETNSGTAYPSDIVVCPKQSHGAPPPQGGSWARAEADVVAPSIAAREAITHLVITVTLQQKPRVKLPPAAPLLRNEVRLRA